MSSSDETTVEAESPLVIKRPLPRKQSSSESEENDSEPEGPADESEGEGDDGTEEDDETEKSPQPVVPVAPKPSSAPKAKNAPRNAVKSKTYDLMVHEAMSKLNEVRRLGVSIQAIVKYVNANYDVTSNRVNFYCKKAIDKGLKENIYVHTSGVGFSGSIAFSVEYWNDMKKVEKKTMKAAEREEKSKAKPKPKPKPKPKLKAKVDPKPTAAKKPKADSKSQDSQPQKDKNNNPTVGKAAAKKTMKTIRLSVNLPTTRAKPKPKAAPGAKTNKEKPSAKTAGKAVPSAKGKQQSAVTTRSKSVDT